MGCGVEVEVGRNDCRKRGCIPCSATTRRAAGEEPAPPENAGTERKSSKRRLELGCVWSRLVALQDQWRDRSERQRTIEAALMNRQRFRALTSGRVTVRPARCGECPPGTIEPPQACDQSKGREDTPSESEGAAPPSDLVEALISGSAINRRHYRESLRSSVVFGEVR